MNAVLICPAERPGLEHLGSNAPVVALPVFGHGLVEHWLDHLSRRGAKQVRVLAPDRPHLVRSVVGDGSRWGIQAEVLPERAELSPQEAFEKYSAAETRNRAESVDQPVAGIAGKSRRGHEPFHRERVGDFRYDGQINSDLQNPCQAINF